VVAPLWRDEMLLVLPVTHPLAGRHEVELGALAREHWIAGCPRCRGHLLELAAVSGFVPTISYETDNFVAVLNMVAAGVGVALIPQLAVGAARIPPGVVVRPTANRDSRTINLVAQAGADAAPAVAATAAALTALDESAWSLRAAALA
jgi:DNA-binding transcriptional LysR family regulator